MTSELRAQASEEDRTMTEDGRTATEECAEATEVGRTITGDGRTATAVGAVAGEAGEMMFRLGAAAIESVEIKEGSGKMRIAVKIGFMRRGWRVIPQLLPVRTCTFIVIAGALCGI